MSSDPKPYVPSKETIEYGRRVIQPVVDLLKEWETKAKAEGRLDDAQRHRFAAFMIDRRFLGSGDGCVITSFDERWLDDDFRAVMEKALPRD